MEDYNFKGIDFYKFTDIQTGEMHKVMYYDFRDQLLCNKLIQEENISSLCFDSRYFDKEKNINTEFSFSKKIVSVSVENKSNDLSFLEQFTNLKELYIKEPKKPKIDLAVFKKLEILSTNWSTAIRGIEKLNRLQHIKIWNFEHDDLTIFAQSKELKEIDLINPKIKSIRGIEELVQVEVLDIEKGRKIERLESFTKFHTNMKVLRIFGSPNLLSCNSIVNLVNLEVITFGKVNNLESLKFLNKLNNLRICGIHPSNVRVNDNSIDLLKEVRSKVN
ncbi:hypothetical protein [Marinifilum fragile]|uniref:hypothetical protein n=1 Tax=Marinifilum fragile TaxID=570161 RepID=UPI002AAB4114|nr:hypothetical protein [Marinifilum fragile]